MPRRGILLGHFWLLLCAQRSQRAVTMSKMNGRNNLQLLPRCSKGTVLSVVPLSLLETPVTVILQPLVEKVIAKVGKSTAVATVEA